MPAWCGGTGLSLHECQVYLCRENLIGRIFGKAAKPHPVIAERNEACPDWTGWDKGENHGIHQGAQEAVPPGWVAGRRRDRIYRHGMRRRERGSPGPGVGPRPVDSGRGQPVHGRGRLGGSASQESCVIGYFERDMSFGNAMAVVSVDPASGPSMSAAQVKAALVSKYGTAEGDAINAQFGQVVTDSDNNCGGSAASSTAPAAAPAATADPAGQQTRPRRRSHRAPWTA